MFRLNRHAATLAVVSARRMTSQLRNVSGRMMRLPISSPLNATECRWMSTLDDSDIPILDEDDVEFDEDDEDYDEEYDEEYDEDDDEEYDDDYDEEYHQEISEEDKQAYDEHADIEDDLGFEDLQDPHAEPYDGVTSEFDFEDPTLIKVPYLREDARQDIFGAFMTDPKTFSIEMLAQKYRTTPERTQAIILLLKSRYDMMKGKGFSVKIVQMTTGMGQQKFTVSVDIPVIYDRIHRLNAETADLSVDALKEQYKTMYNEDLNLDETEVKRIITEMVDHYRRANNAMLYEKRMENDLEMLRDAGANIDFCETQKQKTYIKAGKKSIASFFSPTLFSDENSEYFIKKMLKRVEAETRGKTRMDLDYYLKTFAPKENEKTAVDVDVDAPKQETRPIRWKYAFKDNSKKNPETIIRTRTGKFRVANPLEELGRSWSPKIPSIDTVFANEFPEMYLPKVRPYQNVDGDDHIPAEWANRKLQKFRDFNGGKKK